MENLISKLEKAVNGDLAPTEVYAELLGEQELIESCIARLKPFVLQELSNYTEKEVKLCGVTWQKKTAPGKWDYSNIHQITTLKNKIKLIEQTAQSIYKSAEKGIEISACDEDGVVIAIPEYTPGKQTFAVLKK